MKPSDSQTHLPTNRKWPTLVTRGEVLAVLLAAVIFQWHLLLFPLGLDQGIYATSAMKMLEGKALYRETWDMKSPGIFFLYMIPLLAGGGNAWLIHLMHILMQGLAALGMVATGRAIGFRLAGWCSGITYLMISGAWGTPITMAQSDDLMMPFFIWGLLLLWLSARGEWAHRRLQLALAAGALMAWVLLFRSTMFFAVALAPLIWITAGVHKAPIATWIWNRRSPFAAYVLGGLAVGLVALTYFAITRSLYDLYYSQFVWVRAYAVTEVTRDHMGWIDLAKLSRKRWLEFFKGYHAFNAWPLLAVAGTVLCYRLGKGSAWKYVSYVTIGMCLSASNYWIQVKFFNYHHWPLVAFVSMYLGLFFAGLIHLMRRAWPIERKPVRIIAWLLLFGVIAAWVKSDAMLVGLRLRYRQGLHWIQGKDKPEEYYNRFNFHHLYRPYEDVLIQEYIAGRNRFGPEGKPRVFIFGFRPQVYYNLDISGPSRFAYNLPLRASWSPKEWMDDLKVEVERDPPDFILMGIYDYFYWVTGNELKSDEVAPPWLREMIEKDFTKVMRLKYMLVYERNRETDPPVFVYPPSDLQDSQQQHDPTTDQILPGGSR
jgi:hypothetical protein